MSRRFPHARRHGTAGKEHQQLRHICLVCAACFIYLTCSLTIGWGNLLAGYSARPNAPLGAASKKNTKPIHFNNRTYFSHKRSAESPDHCAAAETAVPPGCYFQLRRSMKKGRRYCQPHHSLPRAVRVPFSTSFVLLVADCSNTARAVEFPRCTCQRLPA